MLMASRIIGHYAQLKYASTWDDGRQAGASLSWRQRNAEKLFIFNRLWIVHRHSAKTQNPEESGDWTRYFRSMDRQQIMTMEKDGGCRIVRLAEFESYSTELD